MTNLILGILVCYNTNANYLLISVTNTSPLNIYSLQYSTNITEETTNWQRSWLFVGHPTGTNLFADYLEDVPKFYRVQDLGTNQCVQ